MSVIALAFQQNYACAHSGKCCKGSWNIPIRQRDLERLQKLKDEDMPIDWQYYLHFISAPKTPNFVATFKRHPNNACVFLLQEKNRCQLHLRYGEKNLPAVCRVFPRIRKRIGAHDFYGLSATCPTALKMFGIEDQIRVVVHKQFHCDLYPASVVFAPHPLSCGPNQIQLDAFMVLKHWMTENFGNGLWSPDQILLYNALVSSRLSSYHERTIDLKLITKWLKEEARCSHEEKEERLATFATQVPNEPGAGIQWLKIRNGDRRISGLLQSVITQVLQEPQPFAPGSILYQQYRSEVVPFLACHHWPIRNFLALSLFLDHFAHKFNHWNLGMAITALNYNLLKLVMTRLSYKQKLAAADLYQSIEIITDEILHQPPLIKKWIESMPMKSYDNIAFLR